MLFLLIMAGSAIFVSSAILHIRKGAFEKKLEDLAERRMRKSLRLSRSFTFSRSKRKASSDVESAIASGAVRGQAIKPLQNESSSGAFQDLNESLRRLDTAGVPDSEDNVTTIRPQLASPSQTEPGHIRFHESVRSVDGSVNVPTLRRTVSRTVRPFSGSGVGVKNLDNHPRNIRSPISHDGYVIWDDHSRPNSAILPKVHRWTGELGGYIGRNSQFHNLSDKERKKLGGMLDFWESEFYESC